MGCGRFLGEEWRTYVFLVVVDQACVLEVRVEFDLVACWNDLGSLQKSIEVSRCIVGDTNRLCQPLGFDGLHLCPSCLDFFVGLREPWLMDQVAACH